MLSPKISMPKKRVKSTGAKNKPLDKQLVENLVELQKVHVTLIEKFDSLSEQIRSLLSLFEMTAKQFSEGKGDDALTNKLDELLGQNKTLAKGLTLLEQKMREKIYGPTDATRIERRPPSRLQRF